MVLQQTAQMLDMAARTCRGQTVMGEGYRAGGDRAEELEHLEVSLPGEDAFRSIDAAQDFEECFHRGGISRVVKEDPAEVVAQCASCANAGAVDLAFLYAGAAGEVAGDPGAGQADRPGVGVVGAAWKDAIVAAERADAVRTHRGVEAAMA